MPSYITLELPVAFVRISRISQDDCHLRPTTVTFIRSSLLVTPLLAHKMRQNAPLFCPPQSSFALQTKQFAAPPIDKTNPFCRSKPMSRSKRQIATTCPPTTCAPSPREASKQNAKTPERHTKCAPPRPRSTDKIGAKGLAKTLLPSPPILHSLGNLWQSANSLTGSVVPFIRRAVEPSWYLTTLRSLPLCVFARCS